MEPNEYAAVSETVTTPPPSHSPTIASSRASSSRCGDPPPSFRCGGGNRADARTGRRRMPGARALRPPIIVVRAAAAAPAPVFAAAASSSDPKAPLRALAAALPGNLLAVGRRGRVLLRMWCSVGSARNTSSSSSPSRGTPSGPKGGDKEARSPGDDRLTGVPAKSDDEESVTGASASAAPIVKDYFIERGCVEMSQ